MNKSRKLIVFLCVLATSIFCMLGMTGCGNILRTECVGEHTLFIEDEKDATCFEDGYKKTSCEKCSYEVIEVFEKHIPDYDPKDPYANPDKGYTIVRRKDSTCAKEGNEQYKKCAICGTPKDERTDEQKAQDERNNIAYNEAYFAIPKKPHDTKHKDSTYANCQEKAYCGVCKSTYGTVLKDHKYQEVKIEKIEPTCTTVGYSEHVHCALCSYQTERKELPALHHDGFRDEQFSKTISEVEFIAFDSSINLDKNEAFCGICRQEYVPVCVHYSNYKNSKAATCYEAAYCGRCERSYGDALGHDIEVVGAVAPTCLEVGHKEYDACQRVGCSYNTRVEIPAQGHLRKDLTVEATCIAYGYEVTNFCVYCDFADLETAVAHVEEYESKTPSQWNSHKRTCDVCKKYADKITLAYGHDVDCELEFSEKWTCVNQGFCGRCKEYYGEVIGYHSGGEANCGYGKICERCGVEYTLPTGEEHKYNNNKNECTVGKKKKPTE